MSNWVDVILNNIKIEEEGNSYVVSGLRTYVFLAELKKQFGTIRIENGMFSKITMTSLVMNKFFLFDFYQVVGYLSENATGLLCRIDVLSKLLEELERLPAIKNTHKKFPSSLDASQLERFPLTPLPAQTAFFEIYDQKRQQYGLNGYILAADPGTGKTFCSLMLMAMRQRDITFVFSPNNALREVWDDTLKMVSSANTLVYPDKPVPGMTYTHYVFNHENTKFAKDAIRQILADNPRKSVGVIVDECHRFTELKADQTQNLIEICRMTKSEDIVFMSGTPFKAMGRELLPFLMATDPLFKGKTLDGFTKIVAASSWEARQIVAARIGRTIFRVEKTTVVNNQVTDFIVKVKVQGGERFTIPAIQKGMRDFISERTAYYKKNSDALIAEYHRIIAVFAKTKEAQRDERGFEEYKRLANLVRNTRNLMDIPSEVALTNHYEKTVIIPTLSSADKVSFRNVKSVYKYLPLKIRGEALGRILGAERVNCNVAIMKNIDNGVIHSEIEEFNNIPWTMKDIFAASNSKVVMFSDFIEVLDTAKQVLTKQGFKPELVYGETNKDLSSIVKRFGEDPKVNPIVATFKSLSTAVPLIMADTCVLLNAPFRSHIRKQTVARVDRLGQKFPVKVYTYQLDTGEMSNISTRSNDIMEWSQRMVDELLGYSVPVAPEDIEEEIVQEIVTTESRKSNFLATW